jgi:antitoxin VapB
VERVRAAAEVDAAVLAGSRPGATLGGLFEVLARAYEAHGFPEEWRRHHQGGLTGYRGREVFAAPGDPTVLPELCAVAWNPSVTGGGKSEDTALISADGVEVLTQTQELGEVETAAGITRSAIVVL